MTERIFFKAWKHHVNKNNYERRLEKLKEKFFPLCFSQLGIKKEFKTMTLDKKVELMHVLLEAGRREIQQHFGSVGLSAAAKFSAQFMSHIHDINLDTRFQLAEIAVKRSGLQAIEKYNLSEVQILHLQDMARKRVQDFLPSLVMDKVDACIHNRNIEGLKYQLFLRFSGPYRTFNTEIDKLNMLTSENIEQAEAIIPEAIAKQEAFFMEHGLDRDWHEPERGHYWSEEKGLPGNTIVRFSHGGGLFYLLHFLQGKIEGYPLERPGKGIQVSPISLSFSNLHSSRDTFYANKAALNTDYPARLTGEIEIQYLDTAPNGHEAGLRAEFIPKLTNLVLKRLDNNQTYPIGSLEDNPGVLDAIVQELTDSGQNPAPGHL